MSRIGCVIDMDSLEPSPHGSPSSHDTSLIASAASNTPTLPIPLSPNAYNTTPSGSHNITYRDISGCSPGGDVTISLSHPSRSVSGSADRLHPDTSHLSKQFVDALMENESSPTASLLPGVGAANCERNSIASRDLCLVGTGVGYTPFT
jgi:hypothetical protein